MTVSRASPCLRTCDQPNSAADPSRFSAPSPAREQLAPQTDPQNRNIRRCRFRHQRGQFGQIGVQAVVQRRLLATKDHQRIKTAALGQGPVQPGPVQIHQRRLFVQRHPDLPMMGNSGILHDRNAHQYPQFSARRRRRHKAAKRHQVQATPLRRTRQSEKGTRQTNKLPNPPQGGFHGDSRGAYL